MLEVFIPMGLVVVVLAICVAMSHARGTRNKRELKATPVTPVSDVVAGQEVKIVGELSYAEDPLEAPLSGRPCACYHLWVQEAQSSGQSTSWVDIINEVECQPFYIQDATGQALVRDPIPEVVLHKDVHKKSGTFNAASEQLQELLARYGHETKDFLGMNKSIRYTEGVLEEGEVVAALGIARHEAPLDATAGHGASADAPALVVLEERELGGVLLSDEPATLG